MAQRDDPRGAAAVRAARHGRVQDVIRYWRESRKFGVVDPLTGTTSECDLTGDATKMIAARFEAETGRPEPRGYVACRGALSEAFMDGALATHLPWSGLQAA